MTKREIAEIEKLLNDYSFLEAFAISKGSIEDAEKDFAKAWAVHRVCTIFGYRTRLDGMAEQEGVKYNHYKVERWS